MSVHKKFSPFGPAGRLTGYKEHIYTIVLFYYIDIYIFLTAVLKPNTKKWL